MSKILLVLLLFLLQGCLTTTNMGTISKISEEEVSKLEATEVILVNGVLLAPLFLIADIIISPIEVLAYDAEKMVGELDGRWNFKWAYDSGK